MRFLFFVFFSLLIPATISKVSAQVIQDGSFSYTSPEQYLIADISYTGIETLDANALTSITGLKAGDIITIPGEDLSNAIKKIWDQKLVGDVAVNVTKVEGNKVYLNFSLTERPRVSKINFIGIKKAAREELQDKITITLGQVVTDAMIKNARYKILEYYIDKGFLNAEATITQQDDTTLDNRIALNITINKGKRVRIDQIIINGNEKERETKKQTRLLSDEKLKRKMKETKEKSLINILSSSKFIEENFEKDKESIINYYNSLGYRDARIISDTIYPINKKRINVELTVEEGPKYYFRNITWKGNYIYSDKVLDTILNIRKGDVYSLDRLERRLNYNPDGFDISSLYLDDGYLFFHVEPIEVLVENDSIDLEMRVYEGPQATIKNITVAGNTKTHDHVVLRELRTIPGQKFSRSDLIRSQREIATLGYFDPEQIGVNPVPNPADGTVDIHYTVAEKPSDQIELSGGWGGQFGPVGTVGVVFNNFSFKNITKFKTWDPLPSGDGQRLSIRFQANGRSYQSYSFSFTEPWLGGKKPHSLTFSLNLNQQHNIQARRIGIYNPSDSLVNSYELNQTESIGYLRLQGGSVSYGKRLKWPDDYFSLSHSISFLQYIFNNYNAGGRWNPLGIDNTTSNNINYSFALSRNSLNDFTFPTSGSNLSLTVTATPPYSLFNNKNYSALPKSDRYKFVEYHKWMVDQSWFATIIPGAKRNLVLNTRVHLGFIGSYKRSTGVGPFERFVMGGDGLSGFNFLLGSEIIGLRGYENNVIVPQAPITEERPTGTVTEGGVIFDKFVMELRYPVNLSPALSVFVLGFLEAGNTWNNFKDFNPLKVYRSAGIGTRIMMPAFGMIGIDWGFPLDQLPGRPTKKSHVTFTIGQQIR